MTLFDKLIEEVTPLEKLSPDAKEMMDKIKSYLSLDDSAFKPSSSKRFNVFVPEVLRIDFLTQILKKKGFNHVNVKGSSLGGIRYKSAVALIKPIERQGRKSAGLDNEDIFIDEINKHMKTGPTDIYIGHFLVKDVLRAKGVGTKIKEYKKTDVVLERKGKEDVNISIKKDNAEIWESSDARHKELVKQFIDDVENEEYPIYFKEMIDKIGKVKEGIYQMFSSENDEKVSGVILRIDDKDEVEDIVFGGEEVDFVAVKTFIKSDFKVKDDGLHINTTKVVENIHDLRKYNLWPYLKIRLDSTRSDTHGLRPVVMTKSSVFKKDGTVKGSVIQIN